MAIALSKNERLVCAGRTDLRAPDGTPLEGVQTYRIVHERDAAPGAVVPLEGDERLLLLGTVTEWNDDRTAAELTHLYKKVGKSEIDEATGMTAAEKANCDDLVIGTMVAKFGECMEEVKALDRQSKDGRTKN